MPSSTDRQSISVHVLAESLFCPRAGLNAFLEESEDEGREDSILRLNYQPSYELGELEARLNALATTLWQFALVATTFFVLGLFGGYFFHGAIFLGGLAATAWVILRFVKLLPETYRLLRDHRALRVALASEPNTKVNRDEPVDWWSLRAAGFTSQPCDALLTDKQFGLVGRPWRILRRGDLAIPAYVRKGNEKLQPQQRMRIAAYCQLVRENEGCQSPYGIVLDQGTFQGTAVKTSPEDLPSLRKAIDQWARTVDAFLHHGLEPKQPEPTSVCSGCPHGRPRRVKIGQSETKSLGAVVQPFVRTHRKTKRAYHSPCGDRFGWIPPHDAAGSLDLL